MKKIFLKMLAVLLSAATILTAMPVSTFAFEETAQESEITAQMQTEITQESNDIPVVIEDEQSSGIIEEEDVKTEEDVNLTQDDVDVSVENEEPAPAEEVAETTGGEVKVTETVETETETAEALEQGEKETTAEMPVTKEPETEAETVVSNAEAETAIASKEVETSKPEAESKATKVEEKPEEKETANIEPETEKTGETKEAEEATSEEKENTKNVSSYEAIPVTIAKPAYNSVFAYPLPSGYTTITSPFGNRSGEYAGFHTGIDISAPEGTPVYAAKAGTVIISDFGSYQGNYIVIDHGNGIFTEYHHLSVRHAAKGDSVKAGQVIGKAGTTGNSTGSHLHFMIMISDHGYDINTVVNPYDYIFTGSAMNTVNSLDFSSKRLMVAEPFDIMFAENLVSSYKGIYLYQFENETDAKLAYLYYMSRSSFIEIDTGVSIAEGEAAGTVSTDTVMTEDDNPFDELLMAIEQRTRRSFDIALIDTGADGADRNVSMLGRVYGDENGHGTRMLSYIKEQNPDASVLSIKALGADGTGDVSAVYAAIEYAMSQDVKIINLSISALASEDSEVIEQAVNEAVARGIIVVGAAGNNGSNAAYYVPGGIASAVIAGAADENGKRLSSSNFGETVDYNVIAASTSEAAAKLSGFISKYGYEAIAQNLNQGFVFTPEYEPSNGGLILEAREYDSNGKAFSIAGTSDEYLYGYSYSDSYFGATHDFKEYLLDGQEAFCIEFGTDYYPGLNYSYYYTDTSQAAINVARVYYYVNEYAADVFGITNERDRRWIIQKFIWENGYSNVSATVYASWAPSSDTYSAVISAALAQTDVTGSIDVYINGGTHIQPVGMVNYELEGEAVTVTKTSLYPDCTAQLAGNSLYSQNFAGAEFSVNYYDKGGNEHNETFTTGSDGTFTVDDVKVGSIFTATETKAPKGYSLPAEATKSITVVRDGTNSLEFKDTPLFDPIGVLLKKEVSTETGSEATRSHTGDEQ